MGDSTCCNLCIAVALHVVAASLNERHFVVPPHYVPPVWLVVLLESLIELEVLSDAHDDVIICDAWVRLVTTLVPLALLEVEGTHTKGNIHNSTLLCGLALNFNSGELSILISRHEQDSALA